MKMIFAIIVLLASEKISSQPLLADKIVGIVDDRIVLLSEIENQFLQYKYQSTTPLPEDFKCQILDDFLTNKLLTRQAELDSVVVTDADVEQQLDFKIRSFASMIGSIEKLEDYYGKSVVEIKDEFRPQIREKILADQERAGIVKDIKVTPSDVTAFFNKIPADSLPYFNSELELGQLIILPKVNEQVKEYSKQQITDLLNRVKKGESFAALARTYSKDGSADQGGELGFVNRGELDPSFEAAAFSLKNPGDVSQVVESAFGFHIIQLIERRGDKINVRHILIKPQITSFDISKAQLYADSIYHLIHEGKYSFDQAVNKFSQDEESKGNGGMIENPSTHTTQFEAADLGTYDQSLVPATDTLNVGDVTKPMIFRNRQNEVGFRIIYLKSRSDPHQMNMQQDYNRIQDYALTQKQFDAIKKWIDDRISKSYVFVAPEFQNCNVIEKWINKQE